jgi:hypothetical protein
VEGSQPGLAVGQEAVVGFQAEVVVEEEEVLEVAVVEEVVVLEVAVVEEEEVLEVAAVEEVEGVELNVLASSFSL